MANTAPINTQVGLNYAKETCQLINRTGGTLSRGDLVAIPFDFGDTIVGIDPHDETDGAAGYVGSVAVTPTAANACHILAVLDQNTLADNERGTFCVKGIVKVGCENGVTKGDFITAYTSAAANAVGTHATRTNAGTVTGFTRAELDSQQAATGILGFAKETTDAEETALCLFNGYAFQNIVGGGA